jgi:vacuolar-type H+-ATPase subunit D/Vma8
MTKAKRTLEERIEHLQRRFHQAYRRANELKGHLAAHEKRQRATRHYRLGVILERILVEDVALRARIKACVERESPRVRAVFALHEPVSWFEQLDRADTKKAIDTRRFRLGMIAERLLPSDAALRARIEASVREQPPHVQEALTVW